MYVWCWSEKNNCLCDVTAKKSTISISIRRRDKCKIQTTEWSACSKTCGWGVSERVITDKACKLRKQTRLCQLRPCSNNFLQNIKVSCEAVSFCFGAE